MSSNSLPKTISVSINLSKIDPQYIVEGKEGAKYINLRLVNTPNSEYGHDFMVTQDLDKTSREAAKASGNWPKTPILGNGKAYSGVSQGMSSSGFTEEQRKVVQPIIDVTQEGESNDLPF